MSKFRGHCGLHYVRPGPARVFSVDAQDEVHFGGLMHRGPPAKVAPLRDTTDNPACSRAEIRRHSLDTCWEGVCLLE